MSSVEEGVDYAAIFLDPPVQAQLGDDSDLVSTCANGGVEYADIITRSVASDLGSGGLLVRRLCRLGTDRLVSAHACRPVGLERTE